MTQVQQQYYSNKTYKRTISKVTTAQSSRNHSALGEDFQGVVRSKHFQTLYPIQPQQYLKAARKTMIIFPQYAQNNSKNIKNKLNYETDPLIDQQVWKFTMSILDRFNFTYETIGLGISFYLKLLFSSYPTDQRPLYLKKFHMSGCIQLAAKSIEVQTKIPKPQAYQYFCGQNYTSEDYKQFQRFLITALDYDLQKSTIFTFLNVYLSMGIFYKNEIFETAKQIQQLENEILQSGLQSLRKCIFLHHQNGNPEIQAINIIKDVRKKYYLTEESKNFNSFTSMNTNVLTQRKRLSCLSFTHSTGNLFYSQNSSFYTQRNTNQNPQQTERQSQKGVRLSRKKDIVLKNKTDSTSGSQILKRKPNLDKSYKKKEIFENFVFAPTKTFKYVALKDDSVSSKGQQKLTNQLIKCKSASNFGSLGVKYQKSNLNINSQIKTQQQKSQQPSTITSQQLDSKLQQKCEQKILKSSRSFELLNQISLQNVKSIKKLSKLSQLKQDHVIEKSRSKSKSRQSKFKVENSLMNSNKKENNLSNSKREERYFHRKKQRSNSSKKDVLNHSYYKNNK